MGILENTSEKLLEIQDASIGYRPDHIILDNVSLDVCTSEVVLVEGGSGAGKTALAKAMMGFLQPVYGSIRQFSRTSLLSNKGLGLNPELTVYENILYRYYFFCSNVSRADSQVKRIIEFSELACYTDCSLRSLPSLLKSRLALSLYMLGNYDLIIIDETLGLNDPDFKEKARLVLEDLLRRSKAAVVFHRGKTPFSRFSTSEYKIVGKMLCPSGN